MRNQRGPPSPAQVDEPSGSPQPDQTLRIRPSARPHSQPLMSGGSIPRVVRIVQIWLRCSVAWLKACTRITAASESYGSGSGARRRGRVGSLRRRLQLLVAQSAAYFDELQGGPLVLTVEVGCQGGHAGSLRTLHPQRGATRPTPAVENRLR